MGAWSIGIVGGGFSGSLLAVHLMRGSQTPLRVILIERRPVLGCGAAYATQNPDHLLNVRAANMSAFQHDPAHFVRWLWAQPISGPIPPSGHAFVPRRLYRAYIADLLDQAKAQAAPDVHLDCLQGGALELRRDKSGLCIQLEDGPLRVDYAVLCIGNFPPDLPESVSDPGGFGDRYISDPWEPGALAAIRPQDSVFILGTGLTMVDAAIELDRQGHAGSILALSRRGLLPQPHAETRVRQLIADADEVPTTVSSLLRLIRSAVAQAADEGQDWRAVIDGLRPFTQAIWRRMPLDERRRFLRHMQPWWDVHRHRTAPQVAERIIAMQTNGQLAVAAGRLVGVNPGQRQLAVSWRPRHGDAIQEFRADWIVNCAGPQCDYGRIRDPLVRNILARGMARPDALRLGLDVDDSGALLDSMGRASDRLYVLGPPTRGALWEITAVPDIRKAAEGLATTLLQRCASETAGLAIANP